MAARRKLTHSELVRSIRFMIAAEFEAIQLYEQLAESTDNELARKVLLDITKEEKEHVGEFRHLLMLLAPGDEPDYEEGVHEAEDYLAPIIEAGGGHCCCGDECGCHSGNTGGQHPECCGAEGSCNTHPQKGAAEGSKHD